MRRRTRVVMGTSERILARGRRRRARERRKRAETLALALRARGCASNGDG